MTTQVAVRMEPELLEQLDWLIVRCDYENRAEAIRAAVAELARQEREREIDEQIAEAYARLPRQPHEIAPPDFTAWDALDDEDWSDW